MENRVGDNLPTPQQMADWKARLAKVFEEMKPYLVKLSADDKQHLAAFRPGGEAIIALVGDLADKYGIKLEDMPVAGMRNDLALSQMLAPFLSEVSLFAAWITDALSASRSEAWQAATGNYSVLSRVSDANASLAAELKPAKEFFARRTKPEPKEPKGPKGPSAGAAAAGASGATGATGATGSGG